MWPILKMVPFNLPWPPAIVILNLDFSVDLIYVNSSLSWGIKEVTVGEAYESLVTNNFKSNAFKLSLKPSLIK